MESGYQVPHCFSWCWNLRFYGKNTFNINPMKGFESLVVGWNLIIFQAAHINLAQNVHIELKRYHNLYLLFFICMPNIHTCNSITWFFAPCLPVFHSMEVTEKYLGACQIECIVFIRYITTSVCQKVV